VPTLLLSPYAPRGRIDHTQLDFTSLLKFIETNWDLAPLSSRDEQASDLTSAFDFSQAPRQAVLVSGLRQPAPAADSPRAVIYGLYGGATCIFLVLLAAAAVTWRFRPRGRLVAGMLWAREGHDRP
jgi:phospholipase C